MTLKQIAELCSLDYSTVYSSAARAGILVRGRKKVEYNEPEVLRAVSDYLDEKQKKLSDKQHDLLEMELKVMKAIHIVDLAKK